VLSASLGSSQAGHVMDSDDVIAIVAKRSLAAVSSLAHRFCGDTMAAGLCRWPALVAAWVESRGVGNSGIATDRGSHATGIVHQRGCGCAVLLLCCWSVRVGEDRVSERGGVAGGRAGACGGGEAGDHAGVGGVVCAVDGGRVGDLCR
jgi:hypothetical protein